MLENSWNALVVSLSVLEPSRFIECVGGFIMCFGGYTQLTQCVGEFMRGVGGLIRVLRVFGVCWVLHGMCWSVHDVCIVFLNCHIGGFMESVERVHITC